MDPRQALSSPFRGTLQVTTQPPPPTPRESPALDEWVRSPRARRVAAGDRGGVLMIILVDNETSAPSGPHCLRSSTITSRPVAGRAPAAADQRLAVGPAHHPDVGEHPPASGTGSATPATPAPAVPLPGPTNRLRQALHPNRATPARDGHHDLAQHLNQRSQHTTVDRLPPLTTFGLTHLARWPAAPTGCRPHVSGRRVPRAPAHPDTSS